MKQQQKREISRKLIKRKQKTIMKGLRMVKKTRRRLMSTNQCKLLYNLRKWEMKKKNKINVTSEHTKTRNNFISVIK